MKKWIKSRPAEALIIATLALALLFRGGSPPPTPEPAVAALAVQIDSSEAVRARADSLERALMRREQRLAAAVAQRNEQLQRADSLEGEFTVLLEEVLMRDSTDSASAQVALVAAVETIEALREVIATDSVVIEDAAYVINALLWMNRDLYEANVNLSAAAQTTVVAVTKSRPKWYHRLKPDVGVGLAAGLGEDGRAHTVTGLTVGWRIR